MALRKFIIERDIPAVGSLEREQLQGAAAKSNGVDIKTLKEAIRRLELGWKTAFDAYGDK